MYKKKNEKRKKITALIVSLILLFIFSFKLNNVTTEGNKVDNDNLKISALTLPIYIDDLGFGDYTWEEAASEDWCSGSGTDVDPYILENLEINGGGVDECIVIQNSEAHFIIRNCILSNGGGEYGAAIGLGNVTNGEIIGNNFSNTKNGIWIEFSSHNNIVGNTINGSGEGTGIVLWISCNYNTIDGNFVENSYQGMGLLESDNNTISGNTLIKNRNFGIWFLSDCDLNNISGNIASDHTEFSLWGADGIYILDGSDNNTIIGNTANNNVESGIHIENSDFNELSGNNVRNNSLDGIYIEVSDENLISENSISNNILNGIELGTSYYNILSENIVFDNGLDGIYLGGTSSDYNNITANVIYSNNESGITLDDECFYITIWDNEIYENEMNGINLVDTGFDTIYGNVIHDNNDTGIEVSSISDYNLFYENFFLRNARHAFDNGINNDWNNTDIGNYWDNYTGTDANNDGIGDVPHDFGTGIDYLPIFDDTGPIITINSPNAGNAFDDSPDFDITIDEDYLVDMWYTLDGGATTYPFTDFTGTIDQAAWDAFSDGNITLTFYANDKAENTGSAEVIISKDTQAPVIVIIKPAADKKFSSAFSFELEVTDPHLDKIWYSLDGGVTNFTADTPAEKIEKAAWSAVAKGEITITFYASDTLGHVASESVTIKKVSPAIGLDYVTTSILILAISGVAIISIITKIRSKKRIIHY